MAREMKFVYGITTIIPETGNRISLGSVVGMGPDDAILEFVTTRSTDPLHCYADKAQAGRHLHYFRGVYSAEVARKGSKPNGRPIRVRSG